MFHNVHIPDGTVSDLSIPNSNELATQCLHYQIYAARASLDLSQIPSDQLRQLTDHIRDQLSVSTSVFLSIVPVAYDDTLPCRSRALQSGDTVVSPGWNPYLPCWLNKTLDWRARYQYPLEPTKLSTQACLLLRFELAHHKTNQRLPLFTWIT